MNTFSVLFGVINWILCIFFSSVIGKFQRVKMREYEQGATHGWFFELHFNPSSFALIAPFSLSGRKVDVIFVNYLFICSFWGHRMLERRPSIPLLNEFSKYELVDRNNRSIASMCGVCVRAAPHTEQPGARQCKMSLQILLSIIHFLCMRYFTNRNVTYNLIFITTDECIKCDSLNVPEPVCAHSASLCPINIKYE